MELYAIYWEICKLIYNVFDKEHINYRLIDNQQATNKNFILVGASETTRIYKPQDLIYNNLTKRLYSTYNKNIININNSILEPLIDNELPYKTSISNSFKEDFIQQTLTNLTDPTIKYNQWLAGLIDGDGYFGITKGKYISCEILVDLMDENILLEIQKRFGGSVKLRSGVRAIRYRLQNRVGITKLVIAINGNIRNSKRLPQFIKVCNLLNIKPIIPIKLTIDNAWFIGFFDADGLINYYYHTQGNNIRPQLTISVTNKYLYDVEDFSLIFGGNIYYDKSQNGYFKWSINREELHIKFYKYHLKYPSKSNKGKRLFYIKKYYLLYNIKAYIQNLNVTSQTYKYKKWIMFENKWKG